ncbi:MAG: dephospho-CoA kinase [Sphingobacteriales bacterium]|nr:MAG: dephospho-CoA kinase [Sphingobacteriales bacterium]
MLKVGITGGIGSGKSTVCQVFETLGIPVFYADRAAKYLMENDAVLVDGIKLLFGVDTYKAGKIDREKVASIVFAKPDMLEKLNALIHPATVRYGQQWMLKQTSPYVIKEAAIFFESGTYKDMDVMVGVSAPQTLRIWRTIGRDGITQEKVLERIANQMDEEEKMKRCDYVVINDDETALLPQILQLHKELLQKANSVK